MTVRPFDVGPTEMVQILQLKEDVRGLEGDVTSLELRYDALLLQTTVKIAAVESTAERAAMAYQFKIDALALTLTETKKRVDVLLYILIGVAITSGGNMATAVLTALQKFHAP